MSLRYGGGRDSKVGVSKNLMTDLVSPKEYLVKIYFLTSSNKRKRRLFVMSQHFNVFNSLGTSNLVLAGLIEEFVKKFSCVAACQKTGVIYNFLSHIHEKIENKETY